jgi:hypothetical protein
MKINVKKWIFRFLREGIGKNKKYLKNFKDEGGKPG